MERVDGYLSRRAQGLWPAAIVLQRDDGEYVVRRAGQEDLGLGRTFSEAHNSLAALFRQRRAEEERGR